MKVKGTEDKEPVQPVQEDVQDEVEEQIITFDLTAEELELRSTSPYPPVRMDTTLVGVKGGYAKFSVAGITAEQVMDEFVAGIQLAKKKYGLAMEREGQYNAPTGRDPQRPGIEILSTGTDVLDAVQVNMYDKVVLFTFGGWQYPARDARGAEKTIEIFDEDTGFKLENLQSDGTYTPDDWGGTLYVDWEYIKKGEKKYLNTLKVHK